MPVVVLDFETYWDREYTLTKMGPVQYIRDKRFQAQLLGVRIDSGPVRLFETDNIGPALRALGLDRPGVTTVGHNLNGFDALILSERYGIKPFCMLDTICLMRIAGLSRIMDESHRTLTEFLENGFKTEGTAISMGKRWPDGFTEEERKDFASYCRNDVLQCSDNFMELVRCVGSEAVPLMHFCSMTAHMATEPALVVDRERVVRYLDELKAREREADKVLAAMFPDSGEPFLKRIRSAGKFSHMLQSLGVDVPMKLSEKKSATLKKKLEAAAAGGDESASIQIAVGGYEVYVPALSKNDLEFVALLDHSDERVRRLVQLRLEHNSSIQQSRGERLLALTESNNTLPVLLNALRADTGRYTAGSVEGTDGVNMQNMSKRSADQLELRRCVRAPDGYKLVAVDSSQIEARMLAWVAGQRDLVEHFRMGRDPYSELATKFSAYSAEDIKAGAKSGDKEKKNLRNAGKTAILSCGYGVGWKKYATTLLRQGCQLSDDIDAHYEQAQIIHSIYRSEHQNIVAFWKRCDALLDEMYRANGEVGFIEGTAVRYGRYKLGGDMVCGIRMPFGNYTVWYPGLAASQGDYGVEWTFDRRRGKNVVKQKIYGGMVTENIIQSLSFMLLAWQALRMNEDGVRLAGNIHDCWFSVCREIDAPVVLTTMENWMSKVPPWLDGFPVACEGEIGEDYTVA